MVESKIKATSSELQVLCGTGRVGQVFGEVCHQDVAAATNDFAPWCRKFPYFTRCAVESAKS